MGSYQLGEKARPGPGSKDPPFNFQMGPPSLVQS